MITNSMLDAAGVSDFATASRSVLAFLQQRLGFDLWMVTRTEGEDWIVLQTEDLGYGVQGGDVFPWADSFCSRMVEGEGPRVAPASDEVPVYASAAIGRVVPIGAYVGVPLTRQDGSLFGTLCAIHPTPQPEAIRAEQPLIELMAGLLSSLLSSEMKATEEARRAERAQAEAFRDGLTGLYNRRGWDHLLAVEEERCSRYGHPACVISIDLDGLKQINDTEGHAAGDNLICRAAAALQAAARAADVVARFGGDEFAILGVECDQESAFTLLHRLRETLKEQGVSASLGLTMRVPSQGLLKAWEAADQVMYIEKRRRKSQPEGDLTAPEK